MVCNVQSLAKRTESIAKLCTVAEEEPTVGVGLVLELCMWLPESLKEEQSSILALLTGIGADAALQSHLLAADMSEKQASQLVRLVCMPGNHALCSQLVQQVFAKLAPVPLPAPQPIYGHDQPRTTAWPRRRETMVKLVEAFTMCLKVDTFQASLSKALESQLAGALHLLMAEPELQACGAALASNIMNLDAAERKILQV